MELADTLKPMATDGLTMAQRTLRRPLDFPAVTTLIPTLIPGASAPEMARTSASDLPPLSPLLHDRL